MTTAKLLNDAGTRLSYIDAELGKAAERLGVLPAEVQAMPEMVAAKAHLLKGHLALGPAGIALARVAANALTRNDPELPPIEVPGAAADDPTYNQAGLDPRTMSHTDWAYYFRNGLDARQASIFNQKPVYRNPGTGYTYINRDADFRNPDGTLMNLTGYAGPLLGL